MNDPEVLESLKYLLVPKEEKIRLAAQPYSSLKNFFVPCKNEGYECAEITEENGDDITLLTRKNETVKFKRDQLLQMNPPKYEKCDDMADLTYLSDATVYHNLRERYVNWYIYTYSGLFCVTINPFKRLPLYTMKMVDFYRGKKKNEVPPHLYLVADTAYANMCRDKKNQSMLITGESGAGKTENTKKVIQYFAFVAANVGGKKNDVVDPNKPSLEDQIVSANPVLEAYGNAKTTRNNNSSRFGKFIRIHFTNIYAIAGADIESYLLEKSRITYCMELERNYHIFYQLCSGAFPEINKEIMLEANASKYFYINQGMLTIDKVDDVQEMKDTKKAFDTLCFTQEQQIDLFKLTSGVANWGNQQWKQRPREEQAEPDGTESLEIVAKVLGLELEDLIKGITKPKIKVGNEFVNKGQNKDQCTNSVSALSKAAFARAFTWLVDVANETLDVKELKRAHFIGVLDIAGFETFEYNGFEQICINFTNERLQQFFNNFMFVLEQAEYVKEGIEWKSESFGSDLQATIDLIEKKMGIFAILEEQCIVPKATDMTFKEALYKQHLGKHPSFAKPKVKKGAKFEAHFDLKHYAGVVSYSVDGWLDKNKDPINMTVATLFKESKGNALLAFLFRDVGVEDGAGKKKGGGSQNTISSGHREQLNKLMNTLDATSPHFVRCIIPNEIKTGGVLDAHLVMHQLNCNGVLEGIRICRKGYPSRLIFAEFLQRYGILAAERVKAKGADIKAACFEVLDEIKLDTELYRIGLSKVLFKAGILGELEEHRDRVIVKLLCMLQSQMRRYLVKKNIKAMLEQKKAVTVLQKNAKAFLELRNWNWFKFWGNISPLLQNAKKEAERLAREAEEARLAEEAKAEAARLAAIAAEEAARAAEIAEQERLERERFLAHELENLREAKDVNEAQIKNLQAAKEALEAQVSELEDRVSETESKGGELNKQKKKMENDINELNRVIDEMTNNLNKSEGDNKSKDAAIAKLKEEITNQESSLSKVSKEKKRAEETNATLMEQIQAEEEKVAKLNKLKTQFEHNIAELEESLEAEKLAKGNLDRLKKKLEGDLKASQDQVADGLNANAAVADSLRKKESEANDLQATVEDLEGQVRVEAKKVADLNAKLEEAESEADSVRMAKNKVEKAKAEALRQIEELNVKLEDANNATQAQADFNKRREQEFIGVKSGLEQANAQLEATIAGLKKKSAEAVEEISGNLEKAQKKSLGLEKRVKSLESEVEEAKSQAEEYARGKAAAEKATKALEAQLAELSSRLDDSVASFESANSAKSKIAAESAALTSTIEELEGQVANLNRLKQSLTSQVDEANASAEAESRAKTSLASQLKSAKSDLEQAKAQLEEEQAAKADAHSKLSKANAEIASLRSGKGVAGGVSSEALEEVKRKYANKLAEVEEQLEKAVNKASSLEKTKNRLQAELEDASSLAANASANAASFERKAKSNDKIVEEWKVKCDQLSAELEAAQVESRRATGDMFKFKAASEEGVEKIESLNALNRQLAAEVKEYVAQLDQQERAIHDADRHAKKAQNEKDDLRASMDALQQDMHQVEARVAQAQLEAANARQETNKKLQEKEEEFSNTRRAHQRALESLQAQLSSEAKNKEEVHRQSKKLQSDILELQVELDSAKRTNGDLNNLIKKLQSSVSDSVSQYEEEQKQKAVLRESLAAAEARVNNLNAELNDTRVQASNAEKARKALVSEIQDLESRLNDAAGQVSSTQSVKRKAENQLVSLQSDLTDARDELRNAEGRVKKAHAENALLADQVRREQENVANAERIKGSLESQLTDLQVRLVQAETNSLKSSRREVEGLEARIASLEAELQAEQQHNQETLKQVTKNNRRFMDLAGQTDEEKKAQLKLQSKIEQLEAKVKANRTQIEEAEALASVNLSKFRKAQADLDAAVARAEQAENQLKHKKF